MSVTDRLLDWMEGSPAHVATAVIGLTLIVMAVIGLFIGGLVWLAAVNVWLAIILFTIVVFGGIWYVIYSVEKATW